MQHQYFSDRPGSTSAWYPADQQRLRLRWCDNLWCHSQCRVSVVTHSQCCRSAFLIWASCANICHGLTTVDLIGNKRRLLEACTGMGSALHHSEKYQLHSIPECFATTPVHAMAEIMQRSVDVTASGLSHYINLQTNALGDATTHHKNPGNAAANARVPMRTDIWRAVCLRNASQARLTAHGDSLQLDCSQHNTSRHRSAWRFQSRPAPRVSCF